MAAMRSTTFAEERKSTGTAITPSSRHPQSAMTHSGDWEYPLNSAVPPPPGVKPFGSLDPPKVSPADLGDGSAPLELMQEVGLL